MMSKDVSTKRMITSKLRKHKRGIKWYERIRRTRHQFAEASLVKYGC